MTLHTARGVTLCSPLISPSFLVFFFCHSRKEKNTNETLLAQKCASGSRKADRHTRVRLIRGQIHLPRARAMYRKLNVSLSRIRSHATDLVSLRLFPRDGTRADISCGNLERNLHRVSRLLSLSRTLSQVYDFLPTARRSLRELSFARKLTALSALERSPLAATLAASQFSWQSPPRARWTRPFLDPIT